jgi:hypothetical protein
LAESFAAMGSILAAGRWHQSDAAACVLIGGLPQSWQFARSFRAFKWPAQCRSQSTIASIAPMRAMGCDVAIDATAAVGYDGEKFNL